LRNNRIAVQSEDSRLRPFEAGTERLKGEGIAEGLEIDLQRLLRHR
jgi:hypothetical protein